MLKYSLFVVLLFGILQNAYSQNRMGLKLGVGTSRITDDDVIRSETFRVSMGPAGQIGGFFEKKLRGKFLLGAEVLANFSSGRYSYQSYAVDSIGTISGPYPTYVSMDFLHLAIPVYVGMQFGRWNVKMGVQGAAFLSGRISVKAREGGPDEQIGLLYRSPIENGKKFIWGPRAAIGIDLTDRWELEGSYYHGINYVFDQPLGAYQRMRQAIVAARFSL